MRDGEDHVHVLHRQQFLAALSEPMITSVGLAFWTMPGAAGVERGSFVTALTTAIQVSTERRRAAVLNSEEHAEVKPGQPGSVLFNKTVAIRASDIVHLKGWLFNFLCSLRDRCTWSGLESSTLSSGVPAALRWRSER